MPVGARRCVDVDMKALLLIIKSRHCEFNGFCFQSVFHALRLGFSTYLGEWSAFVLSLEELT